MRRKIILKLIFLILVSILLLSAGCSKTQVSDMEIKKPIAKVYTMQNDLNSLLRENYNFGYVQNEFLKENISDSVVFCNEIKYIYQNMEKKDITIAPEVKDDILYLPLQNTVEILGGTVTFGNEGKAATVTIENNTFVVTSESIIKNSTKLETTYAPIIDNEVLYVAAADYSKIINKSVYVTKNKVAIISDTPMFNESSDAYIAEEIKTLFVELSEVERLNSFVTLPNMFIQNSNNVTYFTEPNLDLSSQISTYYRQIGNPLVDLGPAIVAGEGKYKDNYTVVRVFNQQQVLHTQFNAYPISVRGGVQVAAADNGIEYIIATAPYSDISTTALRIFDINGGLKFTIKADESLKAPYNIAAGDFLGINKEQILLTSRSQTDGKISIALYSCENGEKIKSLSIDTPNVALSDIIISVKRQSPDILIVYYKKSGISYELNIKDSKAAALNIPADTTLNGVFSSIFDRNVLLGSTNDLLLSNIIKYSGGKSENIDVGKKENKFFSTIAKPSATGYVDNANFVHWRTDWNNSIVNKLSAKSIVDFANITEYATWAKGVFTAKLKTQSHDSNNMWEPCFTHRWFKNEQGKLLISAKDESTGLPRYASMSKNDDIKNYTELDSEFYVGTYALGIVELDRMRIWPLRSFLRDLSIEFRGDQGEPERTVAVSPVHEQEINVPGSIGDYNPYMVSGFRNYMIDLFGSVQEINDKFGTSFKTLEEMDPPRDGTRGKWDSYGENEYFTQWSLYNRYIVNRRIIEAYREAILAGFPPELIKAHQIPEGDAVAGFLGDADTRITPVDVVLAAGTGYGGTRYGLFYKDPNNWLALAKKSGHTTITNGEYAALTPDKNEAYNQLKYMYDNGVTMTQLLFKEIPEYLAAEEFALDKITKENKPRPGTTGGVDGIIGINNGKKKYNIIEIGANDNNVGLLKSINDDGSWEGTVYLSPFHAKVNVTEVVSNYSKKVNDIGEIKFDLADKLQYGDTAELRLNASSIKSENSSVKIEFYHDKIKMDKADYTFTLDPNTKEYRYVFKNQLPLGKISVLLTLNNADVQNLNITLMREAVARKYFGNLEPLQHMGGVSFDIISRNYLH